MRQAYTTLAVETRGRGFTEITRRIADWVGASGMTDGLLTVFVRHTSASLLIQENADSGVQRDLDVRSALTATQLSVPLADGALALGTWQGIYLYEHRTRGHRRQVVLHLIGD